MRVAFLIICLSVIALSLVAMRAEEVAAQQEIQRTQRQMVLQRRRLWQLDAALGELTSLVAVNVRAEEMMLSLLAPTQNDPDAPSAALACGEFYSFAEHDDPDGEGLVMEEFWRSAGGGG